MVPVGRHPLSLAEGLRDSGWSMDQMYVEYAVMGGVLTRAEMRQVFLGARWPNRDEHNKLAAALNEHFVEVGRDHLVGYHEPPGLDGPTA